MPFGLQRAVGLNGDGSFAPSLASDQQQVAELLMRIALPAGGLMTSTGSAVDIPTPFVDGAPTAELVGAIQLFQTVQNATLNVDLRVDPGGPTWELLVALADQPVPPPDAIATIVFDPAALVVDDAPPAPVSGLPTLMYTLSGVDQLLFDGPTLRVTMSFKGGLRATWGQSFGAACLTNPSFDALDRAVKSGSARAIGATALDQACSEFRAQTRLAANGLFGAVQMSVNAVGTFAVTGSLGDQWRQLSVGFKFPDTVVASGTITVSEPVLLPGLGEVM
jgi:hypothetical protein